MEIPKGPPLPKTSVSYSTTESFRNAFPDEVEEQNEKFRERSWEFRLEKEVDELTKDVPIRAAKPGTAYVPKVPDFIPSEKTIISAVMVAGVLVVVFSVIAVKYYYSKE
jgi:hypothetical protein